MAGSAGVELERALQGLDRGAQLSGRQRHAPGAVPRRGGGGVDGHGAREERLSVVRLPQREVGVAEPDQGGEVVRRELARVLEARRRLGKRAQVAVQVPEVVGPAPVARIEGEGVAVVRLGRREVARGHEEVGHLPVRPAELARRRTGIVDTLPERVVYGAHLGLDPGLHRREVGHGNGLQAEPRRRREQRAGCRPASGGAAGDGGDDDRDRGRQEPPGRPHRDSPLPSVSVVHWSAATPFQVSQAPPDHCTCTVAGAADSPRPTRTRGSFADA